MFLKQVGQLILFKIFSLDCYKQQLLMVASVLQSRWIISTAIKSLTIITRRCHKFFKISAWFAYVQCFILLKKISKTSLLNYYKDFQCIDIPKKSFWGSTWNWKKNRVIEIGTNHNFRNCTVLWPLESKLWDHEGSPKWHRLLSTKPTLC